jgi:hypothetical protein
LRYEVANLNEALSLGLKDDHAATESLVEPTPPVTELAEGYNTSEQAEQFLREEEGPGFAPENLGADDGSKGFNQTGINEIITRTDSPLQSAHS